MTFSNCLINQSAALVLDASVIINLLATGHANKILQALAAPLYVTDNVVREIKQGAVNGRPEPALLAGLIRNQALIVKELTGTALEDFFGIVSGPTPGSLGDGEAATLALAYRNGLSAAIDEKKATRIAAERFETLKLVTTVDILASPRVQQSLGNDALIDATLQALRRARMQVREHQFDWVAQLIGMENVKTCPSLKRHAKRSKPALML
jgi:predicted nucleic acid-binding protein